MYIKATLYNYPDGDSIRTWTMQVIGPSNESIEKRIHLALRQLYSKFADSFCPDFTFTYINWLRRKQP